MNSLTLFRRHVGGRSNRITPANIPFRVNETTSSYNYREKLPYTLTFTECMYIYAIIEETFSK